MFNKILIANRGEIACRIVKTARRMGIATVAVYSDADRDALHVEMADEAVAIGPAPAAQSYLVIDRIVQACRDSGAEAVHPGYGFLSEREAFAEALAAAGIVFIGPNVRAIAAMGDKIESKKLALAAKVNTVPGFIGEIKDAAHARRIASDIGYPVMVKASAGGGGKGLRIVHKESELEQAIRSSQNEAKASFGDDRLFIEKFVTEPRHIEIQVMGDKHGNVIHLNERECSIQRRNQKVIEEAPSPLLDAATRKAMGAQAVMLAKAVDYDSAGTVEFIVDKDKNFYFLEMNTRLQVEHPVTELTTGLDLVELMLRSAAGEKLPLAQKDVKLEGSAIEVRVYAEDPYRAFLPSTGRLVRYRPPAEGARDSVTVRNDTGVYEGGEISMFYDPMIAKLCTHAPKRAEAIAAMERALDEFRIDGIRHNIAFLNAIMHHPRFREGRITTAFIAEEYPDGFHGRPLDTAAKQRFASAALSAALKKAQRRGGPIQDFVVSLDGEAIDAQARPIDWEPGESAMRMDGVTIQLAPVTGGWRLSEGGMETVAIVRRKRAAELAALMPAKLAADTSKVLLCPMPGLVVSINVAPSQQVKAGETLAVVEAMKMENVLVADHDVTVKAIRAQKGDSLALDDVIMEFA
ncbi:MAG: acetyl/propionyl/methylcrotonyl-CoA carboxylase subunit alpha [Alphaproteobacteria bacterium]|nr:acetyl/propionyl/methylcrotonyl-CoA carboxylase subunit alpha [Alphaproteobacteria bacterium]MBV9695152.1 acetyl/propionyl/methylcrotonyl-CoA carboxylase subunit alpha [Alphaproteobacteria bacterium]